MRPLGAGLLLAEIRSIDNECCWSLYLSKVRDVKISFNGRYPYKIYAEINIRLPCIRPCYNPSVDFISSESQRPVPTSQDQLPSQRLQQRRDLSIILAEKFVNKTISSLGRGRLSGSLMRHRSIRVSSPR